MAQAVFQVGGNVGSAIGPLLAALIVVPYGQSSIAWFSVAALLGMIVLFNVGTWYRHRLPLAAPPARRARGRRGRAAARARRRRADRARRAWSSPSSSTCRASRPSTPSTSSNASALRADVADPSVRLPRRRRGGHLIGGPIGDRFGRKVVIWGSILGSLPVHPDPALREPVLDGDADGGRSASSSPPPSRRSWSMGHALLPARIGMVSGLFFGFAFGMSGIGAAALGILADAPASSSSSRSARTFRRSGS